MNGDNIMWKHRDFDMKYFQEMLCMTIEQYGEENDISNEDFLLHQYFENPAGHAIINIAVDDEKDELAGQYVVWPIQFQVFGKKNKCVCSLNTLTNKKYRGQKIFTKLAEITYKNATEQSYLLCYGVPNPNSYPGFIKKLKFHELGTIPLMLKPLCPSQMVSEYIGNDILGKLCKPTNVLFRVEQNKKLEQVEFRKITKDNISIIDIFWENVSKKYPIMTIRDSAFVNFRYLSMPRRTYYPYIALDKGKPVCFAVGRIMQVAGMQCGMLADFIYQDGFEYVAQELVKHIIVDMKKNGASLAGCLMFEHTKEYKILKKLGFIRCPKIFEPQPFPLIVRKFDNTMEDEKLLNCKNWFFTMGDYDVI